MVSLLNAFLNLHYTNNMPAFFATNLHFPAAIEFVFVSLYVVAFPSFEPAIPCIIDVQKYIRL